MLQLGVVLGSAVCRAFCRVLYETKLVQCMLTKALSFYCQRNTVPRQQIASWPASAPSLDHMFLYANARKFQAACQLHWGFWLWDKLPCLEYILFCGFVSRATSSSRRCRWCSFSRAFQPSRKSKLDWCLTACLKASSMLLPACWLSSSNNHAWQHG